MDRRAAVDEMKRVYAVLTADVDAALAAGRAKPDQFARRTLVRTYIAFVEGLAFQFRQITLTSLVETDLLTHAELALLREERFQLNSKGETEPRENFQPFLPNLLFSLRTYVKNHGATFAPDTGSHGWEAMRKSVAVRDRLMHPKSLAGLEVSEQDLDNLEKAAEWWNKTVVAMLTACGEADEQFRKLAGGAP
jgi:hypothetical protein